MRHTNYMKIILKSKKLLYIPLLIIMIISVLTMYNSKFINSMYSNYIYKQILWYLIFFSIIILFPKSKRLFKYSLLIYIINVALLILVLFLGTEVNGSRAWFSFKGISFQPSEFMKLSYSLYLTKICSDYKYISFKSEILFLLKILFIFLIPSILIFLEPDTGAIIFLLIITISILAMIDIKKRWFVLIFMIILILLLSFLYLYYLKRDLLIKLIGTSFFYRMDRIINFKNNMQLENSLISIGNANIFRFKHPSIYIPESATDFAFSLFVNTFGLISTCILLICYLLIDIFFISMVHNKKDKTIRIFTNSFISCFIFNQIYNIAMNIGLLPIMGIPLPLLSYGGSSLIVTGFYMAIILKFNNT